MAHGLHSQDNSTVIVLIVFNSASYPITSDILTYTFARVRPHEHSVPDIYSINIKVSI